MSMARQNRTHHVLHAAVSDGAAWHDTKGKLGGHVGGYHREAINK